MRKLIAAVCIAVGIVLTAGCGGGDGATPTYVEVNTLDGTTGIALDGIFRYTFSQAVTTSTVNTSTFFIVPLTAGGGEPVAMTVKAAYDEAICNAENALAATVSCLSQTECILTPESDLTAGMPYAICLSPSIAYASGSAFEGFMATFEALADQCDNSAIGTYAYLMAFLWCTDVGGSCNDPRNHMISLAGSDDGTSWTLIPEFTAISGSVPDIAFYNNFLYVFHTGINTNWESFNACFEQVKSGNAQIVGTDAAGGFVDPSLIVSGDDLYLFYLPGVTDGDPAGCTTYPCTKAIHSALADDAKLESFTQEAGDRASMTLDAGVFADPDIIQRSDGTYLLYVSTGQSAVVYTSASLSGNYAIPGGGATPVSVSDNSGGIPSALAQSDGSVWLYVSRTDGGPGFIRRGVSSDGVTPIPDAGFATVMDNTISSEFTTATGVGSPSIITWPATTWSKDRPPAIP